ncbi:transposase family protein [Kineosporia sp. NBRC 101677]|uniref:transposase family protein n=1 Tax=Kineosporia sp. NBRC 101677 TaxID=3032197 RepID=UPI003321AFC1
MTLEAESPTGEATCHRCENRSTRVHDRYRRTLMEAPLAGRALTIRLAVRRFGCENASCSQTTFSEVTVRHGRRAL